MTAEETVREWEARGERVRVDGYDIWVLDVPARTPGGDRDPILALHGFPTCSYDWHAVLDALCEQRRVVALDFLGFGLSDKPDERYSLRHQADMRASRGRAGSRRSRCSRTTWATASAVSCSHVRSRERCRSR
jgi:hypothetical protein